MLARKRHTQTRTRRGAALVEFACTVPVLFLLIFGAVEFGRIMMVKNALTNAAREGCRSAVLATTLDRNKIDAAVLRYLTGIISDGDVRIDIDPTNFDNITTETAVTVDVSVRYADVSWLPVDSLVGATELHATSTQRRE